MVGKRAESEPRRSYGKMMDGRQWTSKQAKSRKERKTQKESRDDWPRRKDAA